MHCRGVCSHDKRPGEVAGNGEASVFSPETESGGMPPEKFPFPPQVPIKLSLKNLRENEAAVEVSRKGLVDVQPQLCKSFPSASEYLPPEGGRLSPPNLPLVQHFVNFGEGRPQP